MLSSRGYIMKKFWATNGIIEIQISSLEELPEGFIAHKRLQWTADQKKARSGKGNPNYGKIGFWKGKKMPKDSRGETLKQQFRSGQRIQWNKGLKGDPRCKGHTPGTPSWNSGLTEETDDRVKNNLRGWRNGTCQQKSYETKKKNNSFKKYGTVPEKIVFNYLSTIYDKDDIIEQYRDKRYPFNCDFYIKSKDLFIEVNYFWHHGPHSFNPNNEEDIKLLEEWKSKATDTNQYAEAINTWTIRDVNKQNIAKENNLNYKTIYFEEVQRLSKELSVRNIQNNNQVE